MDNETPKKLGELVDIAQQRFNKIADNAMSYEAEKGYAIQLLTNNSFLEKVAREDPASLIQAVTNVAAIGLSLNPAEKQAYLITRNVKVGENTWKSKVFLEPSYMGLCKIATDSGSIEWVQADCVYSNDTFMDNGVGEKPTHTYNAFSTDRGEFVGVYCCAKVHTGDYLTTVMDAAEIHSIRDRSEAYKAFVERNKGTGGPWVSDFKEMAKKSVVRNAFKMWPRTNLNRMAEAVHLSNENEGFEPLISSPEIRDYTADQKALYDQYIEKSDAIGMYVFRESLEEAVDNNLYHSFEKGSKGKYQRIVDDLSNNGRAQITDCINHILENYEDDSAILEVIEDMDNATIDLIAGRLPGEAQIAFNMVAQEITK